MTKIVKPETCSTCRHLHTGMGQPACRRFPPQVSYLIVPRLGIRGMEPVEESRVAFPTVRSEWNCGEYAPRIEVVS